MEHPSDFRPNPNSVLAFKFGTDDSNPERKQLITVVDLCNALREILIKDSLTDLLSRSLKDTNIQLPFNFSYRDPKGVIRRKQQHIFLNKLSCDLLEIGDSHWQKGQVKLDITINVNFSSDQASNEVTINNTQEQNKHESLDEIRQTIT